MISKEIKILYFGTPKISADVLKMLINAGYSIIGVVAQEDKPNLRGNKIEEVPTKLVAKEFNIPVYQFKKIKENFDIIDKLEPDLILTMAYGQIVSHEILEIPIFGCLNLHGSILPKYRGAAPIQYSLLNGDCETGVSLMKMVDKMDAGEVFNIKKIKIENEDNYDSLCGKISKTAFLCFDECIEKYLEGALEGVPQDENEVTFTGKIKPEDEVINFNDKAFNINNKIRALSSKPGAYFVKNGIKYKIFKASVNENYKGEAGKILKYNKKEFIVATCDFSISIEIILKPGKKTLDFKSFYNGNQNLFKENDYINDRN